MSISDIKNIDPELAAVLESAVVSVPEKMFYRDVRAAQADLVAAALKMHGNNQTEVARVLGVSQTTIHRYMIRLGLKKKREPPN
jgi:transcriptional regulator with GAF, ATPase, and Fis domain